MNYETIDILFRSRVTLLDHLEEQGYETTPFRKFSHKEIGEMVKYPPAMMMELVKKEEKRVEGEPTICRVVYTVTKIKAKLNTFTQDILDPDAEPLFNKETTELIVITLEPIAPAFHQMAAQVWLADKVRVRYFQAAALVNNPLKHILVPKHERVAKEEAAKIIKESYATKAQFPFIRFHEDPIARMLGILPGELVRITRPSPTAGEYVTYRVCV